jgi:putative endopeptidase
MQNDSLFASDRSQTVRPQDDLFRYVNGPWLDSYVFPDDKANDGISEKLTEDAQNNVRIILEDPQSPAKKSAILYRSYMDTDRIEAEGITPVAAQLDAIEAAGSKEELNTVLGALTPAGGPHLIDLDVYPDPGNPSMNTIHITQSGIGLPDEAYYRSEHYASIREAYTAMLATLFTLAQLAHTNEDAVQFANTVLQLETAIARYHWDIVSCRDDEKTYNPRTWSELLDLMPHYPFESWIDAWQQSVSPSLDLKEKFSNVIVYQPSFLTGLSEVWESHRLDEWKLWASAHVLIAAAPYLSKDFEDTAFDFFGKVLSGTLKMKDRWRRAVKFVDDATGEEVGQEYVRRHFPQSSKQKVEELVEHLLNAYRSSIISSDWLGEDTKSKALDKLSKFQPKIGYTNHWRDYSALNVSDSLSLIDNIREVNRHESDFAFRKAGQPVDKDEWLMTPQTVNAYYEPTMNVIVFPAAILQAPYFDPDADDAVNYGGIGATIGHEIGHGFDDQGSRYDGDGLFHNWWTQADRDNFEKRTAALISQYDAFIPQQLVEKYEAEGKLDQAPHVQGALTIGENIGDLAGTAIALKAYAETLGADMADDASIHAALENAPVVDGETGLQRFFISYAFSWREASRDEDIEKLIATNPHAPEEFRVNGIVRNIDAFQEAFAVRPGDGMWLELDKRVRIW